jgi:hypothetical protein
MSQYETIFNTDTLILEKNHLGYWLWDETRRMNLSMRANSERDAFVKAMEYYQQRLKHVETELVQLKKHVEIFVNAVCDDEEGE